MRRLVAIPVLAIAVVAMLSAASEDKTGYRVDAIFDRTAALIPGQEVRVAGAKVGSVEDIELTSDRRARVQLEVGEAFGPFHADASCVIRQDSLLGEKFVECDPGGERGRALEGRDGHAPTVPLERNRTPVEIDTVLSTLRLPYRQRLGILLNELGYGLAGRGEDLNDLIRRAHPALEEAHDVLAILAEERERLGKLVEGTDAAVAELAGRRREVQGLVERAAEVTETTASRRGDLQEAIRRLPPLLDELEPSAEQLGSFAREATPAVARLRAAAPSLRTLLGDFDPLSKAAVPALEELARTSRIGRRTVRAAMPVARRLRSAARELPAPVRTATALVESLRDQGGVEGLLSFLYYATAASARFDAVSHILPSFQVFSGCNTYSETPVAGCSAKFGDGAAAPAARESGTRRPGAKRRQRTPGRLPGRRGDPRPQAAPPAAEPGPRAEGGLPQLPPVPKPSPVDPEEALDPLLNWLLSP
jgi:ABC-type transporter Mla subunit MlaD